jgi:hypothetical protein
MDYELEMLRTLGETTWTRETSNEPWENAETGEISGRSTAIAEERGSTSTMYLAPESFAVAEWNGHVRLDPDDELSELIPLDQAPAIAQVSARTLRRWINDRRLRVLAGHVVERELLAVEKERWESRHAGRPGARPCLRA